MQRFRTVLFLLLFVLVAHCAHTGTVQSAETVVPLATGEWVPYSSQHLPGYGAASEIVTAAFQAVGLNVRYDFYPWKRAEASVTAGSVFAAFPYFVLPERVERGDLFLHSQPLFSSVYGIMYSTAHTKESYLVSYRQPRDLLGKRIGILAGTPLVAFSLKDAGVTYEETPLIDFTVRKLYVGRIDYVIDDRAVLTNKVQELFPGSQSAFAFLPTNFSEKRTMHLLVSKKYPDSERLLMLFNQGVQIISTNGTLETLYKRYDLSM